MTTTTVTFVAGVYAIASLITLCAYGFDKRRAVRRGRRIPESRLHMFELLGGWPGALVGQNLFRHKRAKPRYMAVFVMIVLLHGLGWAAWWKWG